MKCRQLTGALCAIVASQTLATTAFADDERKLTYSLTATGASDYMFRGISYTDGKPNISLYQELGYGIAYLGLYSTNIDYGGPTGLGPWEQDIYLGIRPTTGPLAWDLAAFYYIYGNRNSVGPNTSPFDVAYVEFKVGTTYTTPIKNLTLAGTVWLTPDQGYAAADNISYEGTVNYNLPQMGIFSPSVSALLGHSDSGTSKFYPTGYWLGKDSYTYWNAGLKLSVDKYFMDFRYWDTSIDDPLADSRFVFSAGINLLP